IRDLVGEPRHRRQLPVHGLHFEAASVHVVRHVRPEPHQALICRSLLDSPTCSRIALAALGIWVAIAGAPGCGVSREPQRPTTRRTRGEPMSLPEWIKQALIRDEFSFVMFRYDDIALV